MVDKKNVLMAVCNYFDPDNRVYRVADAVQGMGYNVAVLAYHKKGLENEETLGKNGFRLIRIPLSSIISLFRQFDNFQKHKVFQRRAKNFADCFKPAIVHCHDYNTLFLGIYCKKKISSKVIYDSHEYFQDLNYLHRYPLCIRKRIASFERKAIRKFVDEMIVVSPGIAKLYQPFSISSVHVIRNIPDTSYVNQMVTLPDYVLKFLNEKRALNRKLFLYLGTNTQRGRGIDFALRLLKELPEEFGMVSFGAKSDSELDYLFEKSAFYNIGDRYMPFIALGFDQLMKVAQFCFMGLSLIEPIYVSYYHSLPNKLFEYIAMGLPVLSSDIPDQKEIIEKYNVGISIPFDVSRAIPLIKNFRVNSENITRAQTELRWQTESIKLERLGY